MAQRVDSLNWEMMDLLDQADTATPEEKAVLKQKFQAAKKERNELLGGTLADSPIGKLDELGPDTLKSYIKRASSDRAMRNFDQGVDAGQSFQDREPKFDAGNARKDDQRRRGIHKAVDRLSNEATDTVEKDAEGRVKSWAHIGDWKKTPKRDGKPVDPRGEVTNMAGRELQKAKSLKESGMGEADLLFQEIARGNVDIYDIYAHPKTSVEKFVSDQIHEKYNEVAAEQGYHLDDDVEQILNRIQRELEVEYGTDDNMDIEMDERRDYPHPNTTRDNERVQPKYFGESDGDRTALAGQYGHSGKLSAVEGTDADMMDRIKFLAGLTK
jgi:hypothetical protein